MQQIFLTLIFDLKDDRAIFSNWLQKYFKMRAFTEQVFLRNVKGFVLRVLRFAFCAGRLGVLRWPFYVA
jgi:hypothetical protein